MYRGGEGSNNTIVDIIACCQIESNRIKANQRESNQRESNQSRVNQSELSELKRIEAQ